MKFYPSLLSVLCALISVSIYPNPEIMRGQIDTLGGSSATMTINVGGVHQLSGNYSGEIVINASNVTFDLRGFTVNGATRGIRVVGSNVTVQNGTVRGATIGVRIEGSGNHIIGLDLITNTTGMEIVGNDNTITNCNAFTNSAAGFSLVGASRNSFYNCTAIDNGSTGNAFGFVTQDGMANIFQDCIAERTQTTGSSPLVAAGFLLTGTEQKSKILNSQMSNASGSNAYGMRLQSVTLAGCKPLLSSVISGTFEMNANVHSIAWQQIGGSYYLVVGSSNTNPLSLRVLQFDPVTGILSSISSLNTGMNVQSVAWQQIGNNYYVAASSSVIGGPEIRIFQFDNSEGVFSAISSATLNILGAVNSVAWQQIRGSYYLAFGIDLSQEIRIVAFDPTLEVLSLTASLVIVANSGIHSVAWQQIGSSYYLALGTNVVTSGPEVRVLQFNPDMATLSSLVSATFETSLRVDSVAWQQIGSSYYLALGVEGPFGLPEVRVLQFSPDRIILSALVSATFGIGAGVNSVAWQQIGGSYYLAAGNNVMTSGPEVRVLRFNPDIGILSALTTATFELGVDGNTVAWQQVGNSYYLAVGSDLAGGGPEVRVLQFDDCQRFPFNNIIMSNESSGNIIGFQDDASINSTNQWLGNFGANNTTNFTIGSQFPISASTGTGVGTTENIDGALTTGGPAEKIMRTIVDQSATVINQVNTFVQCLPIVITGPTTLSSSSAYSLAQRVDGQITMNGISNVSLNLNGHRVRNIVVQNCNRISIYNGFISGAGQTNALDINNSNNVTLQDLFVTGATYGLRSEGQSTNITANGCFFNSNTSAGVFVENGRGASFYLCTANKNTTDGFVLTGTGHTITSSQANRNSGGTGFKIAANSITNEIRSCSACANAIGVGIDTTVTTSNIAINNFAYINTTTNYSTNIRFATALARNSGNLNYTTNVYP